MDLTDPSGDTKEYMLELTSASNTWAIPQIPVRAADAAPGTPGYNQPGTYVFDAFCTYVDSTKGQIVTIASYDTVEFTAATALTFAYSPTSQSPGKLITATQTAPCPQPASSAIVNLYYFDAAGYHEIARSSTSVDSSGNWSSVTVLLPETTQAVLNIDVTCYLGATVTFFYDPGVVRILGTQPPAPEPSPTANAHYVAMGDSYSSGEGVPDFIAGTDTGSDRCHRSTRAYPEQIVGLLHWPRNNYAFVACSGATIKDMSKVMYKEPSQFDALNATTTLVTVTIGGNDVHFSDVVGQCIMFSSCQKDLDDKLSKDIKKVGPDLQTAYRKILTKAPNAQVRVLLYPRVFSHNPGLLCNGVTAGEATWINEKTTDLNNQIINQIKELSSTPGFNRIKWVNTYNAFDGGELCAGGGDGLGPVTGTTDVPVYMNGFIVDLKKYMFTFHPTAGGQALLARAVIAGG